MISSVAFTGQRPIAPKPPLIQGDGRKQPKTPASRIHTSSLQTPASYAPTVTFGQNQRRDSWLHDYYYGIWDELAQNPRHALRTLAKKLPEGLHAAYEMIRGVLNPPSIPSLRQQISPLVHNSPIGFPKAMIRAHLMERQFDNGFWSYQQISQQFSRKVMPPAKLTQQFITSEAKAYLATHLLALENALAAPDALYQPKRSHFRALSTAINDANGTVQRRHIQLYGNDTRLVHNDLYRLILAMPKVNLHEHGRGSIPIPVIRHWLIEKGYPTAYNGYEDLTERYRVERLYSADGQGPRYERSLTKYMKTYDISSRVVKSHHEAYLAAYLFGLKGGLENVRYVEYRFNPINGAKNGETPTQIALKHTRAIQQGLDDAKDFLARYRNQNFDANMIFSAYRHNKDNDLPLKNPEQARQMRVKSAMDVLEAAIAARKAGLRVTGFDITGDEENYAITDFDTVAARLKQYNREAWAAFKQRGKIGDDGRIGATIHAGETPFSGRLSHPEAPLTGQESVEKAVELFWEGELNGQPLDGKTALKLFRENKLPVKDVQTVTPLRIGHGVRIMYNPTLIEFCKVMGIGLEQCPKSNVQTGAVQYYYDMPSVTLSRHGLQVNICRDNSTVSKTNSCNELIKLTRFTDAKHDDRKRFQLDGIRQAFIFDAQQKAAILREMEATYTNLEEQPVFRSIIEKEHDPVAFNTLLNNPDPGFEDEPNRPSNPRYIRGPR